MAFVTIFLDLLGFGIIIPIAPFTPNLSGPQPLDHPVGRHLLADAIYFCPLWGRLDRIGRRPVMLAACSSQPSVILSLPRHQPEVLFGAPGRFWGANLGTAQALIADSTHWKTGQKAWAWWEQPSGWASYLGLPLALFWASTIPQPSLCSGGYCRASIFPGLAYCPRRSKEAKQKTNHGQVKLTQLRRVAREPQRSPDP